MHMLAQRKSNAKLDEHDYVDINPGDEDDFTPLHYAAAHGHEAVAKTLLAQDVIDVNSSGQFTRARQNGASVNKQKTSDEQGDRPPLRYLTVAPQLSSSCSQGRISNWMTGVVDCSPRYISHQGVTISRLCSCYYQTQIGSQLCK